ncbi:hypothetical protein [Bradyrhizobium canariense]|uniref:hypothetical protein n=1 Tax=Bradyrhizobium canariense TaxID=255045 RepID=UPI001CA5E210|nr:hypothetical protein [Bradyrhizobium canariense]
MILKLSRLGGALANYRPQCAGNHGRVAISHYDAVGEQSVPGPSQSENGIFHATPLVA